MTDETFSYYRESRALYEDNNVAISLSKGVSEYDHTKNILHHYRYCAEAQSLALIKVESIDMKLQ